MFLGFRISHIQHQIIISHQQGVQEFNAILHYLSGQRIRLKNQSSKTGPNPTSDASVVAGPRLLPVLVMAQPQIGGSRGLVPVFF